MKQTIYEQSLTPKYPVGKRIYEGDRVFRYCRALTALPVNKQGAGNGDLLHEQDSALAALAGDLDLTVIGNYALDQFKDGYINIHTDPVQVCLRIKGNDVGDGVNTVIHLKDPLLADVPAGPTGFSDIHANLYNNVADLSGLGGGSRYQVICVPLIAVTEGYYFWGQVWGPIIGIAYAGSGLGAVINQKQVFFWADGSIAAFDDLVAGTGEANGTGFQIAGFMLPRLETAPGVPGDDIFYMLQLSP